MARECVKCGSTERFANGNCKPCQGRSGRAWRERNIERAREIGRLGAKRRRALNPERTREISRQWKARHPERYTKSKRTSLLRRYGLVEADYQALLVAQNGACALCDRSDVPLVIDHDHATDRVRGLLCVKCNTGLGKLGDNPTTLRRALLYIIAAQPALKLTG